MDTSELRSADLARLTYVDCLRHLKAAQDTLPRGKPLRVAFLRSFTVEPIEPPLALGLVVDGYQPTFWFGGYNQYTQEILDRSSALYQFAPDVVLLLTRLDETLPDFTDRFPSLTPAEWEAQLRGKARELAGLAQRAQAALSASVLVQNATLWTAAHLGTFDSQQSTGQQRLVQHFNDELAAALAEVQGVFIWDFDALTRSIGLQQLADAKAWYVSRNPFKQSAYPVLAGDVMRFLRGALGQVKKCVVVDLDNTLWGGVAGEDGLEGIRLGHTYPGNCFRDFQKELLTLYDRGILLAINSKNNPEDALRIIDEHPDMVLRRTHFAAMRINWQDKASNLREIAEELNIGLESFVFVDDNPAECALVRAQCPQCDVVQLPDKPYLLPGVLTRRRGLENIRITDEDRRKGAMYRAQAARRVEQERYSDLDAFLRSLAIELRIEPATPFSVPRIAQLTQKTNQFNMTTRRYTEAQIHALATGPDSAVFSVSSRDRFGDDGVVGVIGLRFEGDACLIDTFLLSCRVIGRGIETAMLAFVAGNAKTRGQRYVVGEFVPTAKNRPAAGFYERSGLAKQDETRFRGDLQAQAFDWPAHLTIAGAREPHSEPA